MSDLKDCTGGDSSTKRRIAATLVMRGAAELQPRRMGRGALSVVRTSTASTARPSSESSEDCDLLCVGDCVRPPARSPSTFDLLEPLEPLESASPLLMEESDSTGQCSDTASIKSPETPGLVSLEGSPKAPHRQVWLAEEEDEDSDEDSGDNYSLPSPSSPVRVYEQEDSEEKGAIAVSPKKDQMNDGEQFSTFSTFLMMWKIAETR